ncbi:MAG: hypothetical protein IPH26_20805 [Sterolibacteriaceae bacterium]|uniref:Uncharacterized protein n=1 Tax=Candidatus Methylophosphatis roskildensis TaxID=2899263 RepID=A0A9D7E7H8_9PROT|nr:hypothetical protein [Candidatus Methylophosphatis roskildensis]
MIEALTPQVLFVSMLPIIAGSSLLGLLISILLLAAYRRSVLRTMLQRSGGALAPDGATAVDCAARIDEAPVGPAGAALYERALQMVRLNAWRTCAAGFAFALVIALAGSMAFTELRTPARFALLLWLCSWPLLLALWLTAPAGRRTRMIVVAAYFALLVLAALVSIVVAEASIRWLGASVLDSLYVVNPPQMLAGWILANGPPTALLLLFTNRRVRAVGPLVLGFATALTSGLMAALLFLMTPGGLGLVKYVEQAGGISERRVLVGCAILVLTGSGAAGWAFVRWIKDVYVRKQASDRSLTLDALWLLFASWYAMTLAIAGLAWVLIGALGFAVYKAAAAWVRGLHGAADRPSQTRGLVFLRVFSLGPRSDRLFDAIARYWRHLGCIDLITGPDVAHSTVQPHQLLDFLAGRLATHFITGAEALDARMQHRDTAPDLDGCFRVNNFFCHADTWEQALPRLVQGGDVVLMDLRNFSERNAGCVHELRHLAGFVPLRRCVLVIDDSTDQAFLRQTLTRAWRAMPAHSPNWSASPADFCQFHLASTAKSLRELVRCLCDAA